VNLSLLSPLLSHERLRPHAAALRITLIGYWIILAVIMHLPRLPAPQPAFKRIDLVAHFVAYALLAGCLVLAGRARHPILSARWKLAWFAILALYAATNGCNLYRDVTAT